jgi:hypothetical protein
VTTETDFKLGVGAAATLLVVAACLGLGGFLVWSGIVDQPEPLVVAGRQVLGREAMRYALSLTGAAMFGTGLFLALRELLNSGREKTARLETNRLVVTGFGHQDEDQAMFYAEVTQIRKYSVRRIPVVEIRGGDGGKITLSAAMFRNQSEFAVFCQELESRTLPYRSIHEAGEV